MRTTHQPAGCIPCRNSDHCRQHTTARNPLCRNCLDHASRDIRALLWDWIDLEQLQIPSLAQTLTGQPNGTATPAMPLAGAPEALQAEIAWVLTTWEEIVRDAQRLSAGTATPPVAPWHTTVTNPPPDARVRDGAAVHRAVGILAPRVADLARLPPTAVPPTGCEDPFADMDGVEALQQIAALHQRARSMLGRTVRDVWLPGGCMLCDAPKIDGVDGPLYRSEPREEGDEPPVWCTQCGEWRTYDDYQKSILLIVWPHLHPAGEAA
jgi:hypothetical protein